MYLAIGGSSVLALVGVACIVLGVSSGLTETRKIQYTIGGVTGSVYCNEFQYTWLKLARYYGFIPVPYWLGAGNDFLVRLNMAKNEVVPEKGTVVDVPLESLNREIDARSKRIVTISFISAGVFFLAIALGLVAWLRSSSAVTAL